MTPKEAKEYLSQYRHAVDRARASLDHLEELQSMATRTTPNYGGEGGGQHQSGDAKLTNAVDKIIEAKSRASDELEMMEATEREVVHTINEVKDESCKTLLLYRYINGKTFEQIAVALGYCWRQTIRLHGKALIEVGEILDKRCH